KHPRQ
ncbi:hypothetical protein VCHENC02_0431B, partial [Vibrio harveyi]